MIPVIIFTQLQTTFVGKDTGKHINRSEMDDDKGSYTEVKETELKSVKVKKDRKLKRQQWSKSWDFVFALLGGSIGLGNVWRFPYLCFKNGGGAFLIPYIFFVVILAIPMVILETSFGQRVGRGVMQSWSGIPIMKGIVFAQAVVLFHSSTNYQVILVWAFKYFVKSFSAVLPWSTCGNPWNTPNCITTEQLGNAPNLQNVSILSNISSGDVNQPNGTTSSATEYWLYEVLGVSSGIDKPGNFRPDLVLYLIILWIGMFLATFKGIKWTAKVVYVTASLPFVLIMAVLIRGATLDGAANGIKYYLIPDAAKLLKVEVWVAAATQVVYSFSIGGPVLGTLGSYNTYHHNFWRDSCIFCFANSFTSFVTGFAVFSTLGFMAKFQNTTVEQVASSGPGLAFIAYPQTLSLLPLPQFWSAIFFLMLLLLGFDTKFLQQESLMALVFDNFPHLRRRKELVHAVACFFLMLAGLSMVTEGGVYIFEIYNNYGAAGWCLFFIVTCECLSISWLYGFDRYWEEMEDMIGRKRGRLWIKWSWKFLGPAMSFAICIYYLVINKPLTYKDYEYPGWAQVIAHMMSLSSALFIPGYAIYKAITTYFSDGKLTKAIYRQPIELKSVEKEDLNSTSV